MRGEGKWSSLEIKLLWRIGELSIFLSHYVILCSLLPLGPLICLRSLYKCAKIQIAALLHSFFCYQKHIFVCLCEGGNFTKQHPSQHKCHYFSKPIWNVDKIPPNSRALLMKWEICPVSWDLPPGVFTGRSRCDSGDVCLNCEVTVHLMDEVVMSALPTPGHNPRFLIGKGADDKSRKRPHLLLSFLLLLPRFPVV